MEDMGGDYMVNYAVGEKRVVVLDIGALVSLVGRKWVEEYLGENEKDIQNLKSQVCEQGFKFGPSKSCMSREMVELPVVIKTVDNKREVLWVWVYVVDEDVPFLIGRKTLEDWSSRIDTVNKVLRTNIGGVKNVFNVMETEGNHFGLEVEKLEKEMEKGMCKST